VAADDLNAPLGQGRPPKRLGALPAIVPQAVAGALSLFVVVVAGWSMIVDDPFGGEPMTVVPADLTASGNAGKKPDEAATRLTGQPAGARPNRYDGPPVEVTTPAPPPGKTVTIIDGTSGKRQEVVIPATGSPAGADGKSAALDERLSESSRHGAIPKVATDGARVSEVYAKPVKPIAGKPNAPRIAIVVGGLGIGAATTNDALGKLPGPVTLGLAPYGSGLGELAARARSTGHEVLLQVPMEPFDYPDNDPGPQTLLTSLDAEQNVDRLHWLMSRFTGYVGIANFMGARFTASEAALSPVIREAGKRGLLYLDDGASQRSLAGQIAGASNVGFAKADLVIDAVPAGADVERALSRLETMARERGIAVGVASALPVSIERIAKWAKAAEGRGVLLVPISAVAKRTAEDKRQTTENTR
jgi:uncharacterized protein